MKRLIAVLALALLGASAQAQTVTCPTIINVPYAPFTKEQAPAPFGDVTQLFFAWNAGGFAIWRYTADGTMFLTVVPMSSLTMTEIASAAYDFGSALFASDPLAAFNAAYLKHLTRNMTDPDMEAVWCPLYPAMIAGKPQPPPADGVDITGLTGDKVDVFRRPTTETTRKISITVPHDTRVDLHLHAAPAASAASSP